jgi:hypothetical protein
VEVVRSLSEKRGEGVFHATNPGTMRHADLLALYREVVDPSHRTTLISEGELLTTGLVTHGRSNCILVNERLPSMGITMRPIAEALRDCMTRYAQSRGAA